MNAFKVSEATKVGLKLLNNKEKIAQEEKARLLLNLEKIKEDKLSCQRC